jgi:hypothetical protein
MKNPRSQPEATRYRRSRPVAAVAKAERATSHSHIKAVGQRGGCSMVYQSALGLTLGIETEGNPAFRLDG